MAQLSFARQLFTAPMSMLGCSSRSSFVALLCFAVEPGEDEGVRRRRKSCCISIDVGQHFGERMMIALAAPLIDVTLRGGSFAASDAVSDGELPFALFVRSALLDIAGYLCARLLWRRQYAYADGLGHIVTLLAIPVLRDALHHLV